MRRSVILKKQMDFDGKYLVIILGADSMESDYGILMNQIAPRKNEDVSPNSTPKQTKLKCPLSFISLHEFYSSSSDGREINCSANKISKTRYKRPKVQKLTHKMVDRYGGFRAFVQFIHHLLDPSAISSLCHGFISTHFALTRRLNFRNFVRCSTWFICQLAGFASNRCYCVEYIPFFSLLVSFLFIPFCFRGAFISYWLTFGHRFHYIGLIN